jgi:hypothetical protein
VFITWSSVCAPGVEIVYTKGDGEKRPRCAAAGTAPGFNSIPKVTIVPILVIWFGIRAMPAVLTAFLISFFPIVVNVATGVAAGAGASQRCCARSACGPSTFCSRSACRVRCRIFRVAEGRRDPGLPRLGDL